MYAAATGSGYGGKPRPVILINAQSLIGLTIKMAAPLTSDVDDLSMLRPVVEPDATNNLRFRSAVMVDVLIAVPQDKLGMKIGILSQADLARVDAALRAALGLGA